MKLIMLLAGLTALPMCKRASSSSEVKHDIARTSVPRDQPLRSCRPDSEAAREERRSTEATNYSAQRPIPVAYLAKVIDFITQNNPTVFAGALARANLCVYLEQRGPSNVGASANAATGEVLVSDGMVLTAESDAQIAAQIAHELAHITMNHAHVEPSEAERELSNRVEALNARQLTAMRTRADTIVEIATAARSEPFLSLARQFRSVFGGLPEGAPLTDTTQTNEELDAALSVHIQAYRQANAANADSQRLLQAYADSNGALHAVAEALAPLLAQSAELRTMARSENRRRETEADDVGYEFYLRSAFNSGDFMWAREHRLISMADDATRPLEECREQLARGQVPEQGTETHPFPCWRIYNILQAEAQRHRVAYAALLPAATRREVIDNPTLAEAKAALRNPVVPAGVAPSGSPAVPPSENDLEAENTKQ